MNKNNENEIIYFRLLFIKGGIYLFTQPLTVYQHYYKIEQVELTTLTLI